MEQDEIIACPVCGGSNIYESGELLGCADCRKGVPASDEFRDRLEIVYGELGEARNALYEATTLNGLLQERCQLLGRALAALWTLISDEDRQEIAQFLDVPVGAGKMLPAPLLQMLERRGQEVDDWLPVGCPPGHEGRVFRIVGSYE